MYLISYKPKTIFSGPIYNFLMTGLGFEVMPNGLTHTSGWTKQREDTAAKQITMAILLLCCATCSVQ